MRLLIISHTPHYGDPVAPAAWGPTVREIDELSTLFESVVHLAPHHRGPAPSSAIAYSSPTVRLAHVRPAGGPRLADKIGVALRVVGYVRSTMRELSQCDAVHVRCPANISLLAVALLAVSRRPRVRWIKYAGNWRPASPEPLSYRLQRWLLVRAPHRAHVTVNGDWPNQRAHVHPFRNPCLTDDEIADGRRVAESRSMSEPVRLVFVGRLESAKGVRVALDTVARLRELRIDATLDLIGDGPDRNRFEQLARELGVDACVCFHGWLARSEVASFYSKAHILLLPSRSEGWPKVISEGMAYGVVPIACDVSGIAQALDAARAGTVVAFNDEEGFSNAVRRYVADAALWKRESERAVIAARAFSYGEYVASVAALLGLTDRPIASSDRRRASAALSATANGRMRAS